MKRHAQPHIIMRQEYKPKLLAILFLLAALSPRSSYCDTIQLKDGREVKGIVIEEYKDRIVFSTPDGEARIMKAEIKELQFDDEETNLIKLGDQARDGKKYMKAVGYYGRALKLNPNSRQAKDGLLYLQLYLSGKDKSRVGSDIRRQGDIDREGSSIDVEKSEEDAIKAAQASLAITLGLALQTDGNLPRVGAVKADSPAYNAGIRKGDILIAIWGRLTGYMTVKEVADLLLKKASPEIRCTIERTIDIAPSGKSRLFASVEDLIGASLSMEFDGLTVAKIKKSDAGDAGLKEGDLIVAIDSRSTRYMSLKKAIESIKRSDGVVKLSLRRDVVIWRKGEL